MKVFALDQARIKGLIFDIDLTLYDNRCYYDFQEKVVSSKLAATVGQPEEHIIAAIHSHRENIKLQTGRRPPLGVTIAEKYGIPMDELIRWREELIHPEHYLRPDFKLVETIKRLRHRFLIAAVTNNPSSIARRTLEILGVKDFFHPIIGLDVTRESKPTFAPFHLVQREFNLDPGQIVSIGDRYEVDLDVPIKHGMAGILIESLADVYHLPDLFHL